MMDPVLKRFWDETRRQAASAAAGAATRPAAGTGTAPVFDAETEERVRRKQEELRRAMAVGLATS